MAAFVEQTKIVATLSAADTATVPLETAHAGTFSLSISGTWAGTLTLQRLLDAGVGYTDVTTFTTNQELLVDEPIQSALWRVGFKAGQYTSGSAVVILAQAQ